MSEVLGKQLQLVRKNKGVTQAQVAAELGVTQNAYSNWEKGKAAPSIESLIKLADFFDTSIDFLCGRKWQMNKIPLSKATRADLIEAAKQLAKLTGKNELGYLMGMNSSDHEDWINKYVKGRIELERLRNDNIIGDDVLDAWEEKQMRDFASTPLMEVIDTGKEG